MTVHDQAVHNQWFFPRGTLARGGWESVVDASLPGWKHTGVRVALLDDGEIELPAAAAERLVVPLSGAFRVDHENTMTVLDGRRSVFAGPTDVLYVGTHQSLRIHGTGRVAVAEAATVDQRPSRHILRSEVPVELRGTGRDSRQVHNFGTPDTLDAAALIVCEVITPAGNWSSHPAHRHDRHQPGVEAQLEEIYLFESAPSKTADGFGPPSDADAFGFFASYSSDVGPIDTNALVRTGDIALVPHGFHGPASAAPEYDLYYLNVMAGPHPARVWRVTDDPRQAWIRDQWRRYDVDDRLPYLDEAQGEGR
jgi:5-deoxy-glucuronate isomerase